MTTGPAGRVAGPVDSVVTPGGVGLAQPTTWIDVRDPCLLVDTRTPALVAPRNLLLGNLLAALVLVAAAPMWGLILLALILETHGRPFHRREVVGARGWPVRLCSFAVRGPCGRMLSRWGCKRLPYLWSILRGDLQWVGTTPRSSAEVDALRARGEPDLAPPGLVTLGHFTPSRPQRDGRLATGSTPRCGLARSTFGCWPQRYAAGPESRFASRPVPERSSYRRCIGEQCLQVHAMVVGPAWRGTATRALHSSR